MRSQPGRQTSPFGQQQGQRNAAQRAQRPCDAVGIGDGEDVPGRFKVIAQPHDGQHVGDREHKNNQTNKGGRFENTVLFHKDTSHDKKGGVQNGA